MLDFLRFEYLTFDCYGTLIDWEAGIVAALRPVLEAHGRALADEQILEFYGELEAKQEAGPYKRYREILEGVVRDLGDRLQFTPTTDEAQSLPVSLPDWPPFADTVAALRQLKTRYKLAIISNTDDDLYAATARRLEVGFDQVITAQQAHSYKPSLNNFRMAMKRIGRGPEKILHVAQSLHHDIAPAKSLGISNVWVNRRAGKKGGGATFPCSATPDLEVPDLKTLAELVRS